MKLSESEREIHVKPLLENGWVLVTARDAIYKEFLFKDFNQVLTFKFFKLNFSNLISQ